MRSLKALKQNIYFNIQQMLFGGFYGSDFNDLSKYSEYHHARDLLSLNKSKALAKCQFGLSFSELKNRPNVVSVHMLSVPKPYIKNYRLFK